jgi:hypothetical protein
MRIPEQSSTQINFKNSALFTCITMLSHVNLLRLSQQQRKVKPMKTVINGTICTDASQIIDVCGFCDSQSKLFADERDKGKATLRSYQKSYDVTLRKEGNDFLAIINKLNKPSEKLDVVLMEQVLTLILENVDNVSEILTEHNISEISDFKIDVDARINSVTFKKI